MRSMSSGVAYNYICLKFFLDSWLWNCEIPNYALSFVQMTCTGCIALPTSFLLTQETFPYEGKNASFM